MKDTPKSRKRWKLMTLRGKELKASNDITGKFRVWDRRWKCEQSGAMPPVLKLDHWRKKIGKHSGSLKELKTFESGGDYDTESYKQYYASFFRKSFGLQNGAKTREPILVD